MSFSCMRLLLIIWSASVELAVAQSAASGQGTVSSALDSGSLGSSVYTESSLSADNHLVKGNASNAVVSVPSSSAAVKQGVAKLPENEAYATSQAEDNYQLDLQWRQFLMSEVVKIDKAIRSLKSESGVTFKEVMSYLLPLISTLVGAGIAFFSFLHQERFKEKREQLRTANKWLLNGADMLGSLERFKRIYSARIGESTAPLNRVFSIPELLMKSDEYPVNLSELVFLLGEDSEAEDWEIMRIRALFSNFTLVNTLWKEHSDVHKKITQMLLGANGGQPFSHINQELLYQNVPMNILVHHVLVTEQAVKLTDDLIVEGHKFLTELPRLVEKRLKKGKVKVGLFVKVGDIRDLQMLLKPTVPVDIDQLKKFAQIDQDKVDELFSTGYPFKSDRVS